MTSLTTGEFHDPYPQQADTLQQLVSDSDVTSVGKASSAGLVSYTSDQAVTLVAVSATVQNKQSPKPQPRVYRMRLTLQRSDAGWLVSNMEFVLALTVLANVLLYQHHAHLADIDRAGRDVTTAADEALPKVLSYNYTALDGYTKAVDELTTGTFHQQITQFVATTVRPTATAQQIVVNTTVVATSVAHVENDFNITLLVFLNQNTTRKNAAAPQIQGVRVEVSMRHIADQWLISRLTPV